jgi:TonB family protein
MVPPTFRSVVFLAGLLVALLSGLAFQPLLHAAPPSHPVQPPSPGSRWATFDLAGIDASGDIRIGTPLKLSLTLNGAIHGQAPMVAICESIHFERQIVAMEPDAQSTRMRATAILEPIAPGKLSVSPKVARIQVTFARSQTDKKLERVMTRIVYVTLGTPATQNNPADLPPPQLSEPTEEDANDEDFPRDATPITDITMTEENLLPLPGPGPGPAYWQHISALLSQSWNRTARRVRHAPSSETVRVRFRMYPSGRAQLIQIEKGSGAREIDEAGIYAVVHAHPFPPLPDDVGSEPVDVHVRMRTGGRTGARDVRPASTPLAPRANAAPPMPNP